MAQRSTPSNSSGKKQPARRNSAASNVSGKKGRNPRAAQAAAAVADESRIFDERTRHDIIGVLFALAALVVFVAAIMPTDAIVTSVFSEFLHLVLGLGAYVLPLFLLAIGATFIIRFEKQRVPARVAIGLAMIFVAVLVLLALFTPLDSTGSFDALFNKRMLATHGGYIGAGVAWVGLMLFGHTISCIIMAGVIVIGLAIIGLSLSKLIETIRHKRAEAEAAREAELAPPFARVKRGVQPELPLEEGVSPVRPVAVGGAAKTGVLPKAESAAPTRRMRRAAAEEAANTAVLEPEKVEPIEGDPAPLTRKLGKKKAAEKPAATETAAAPKKSKRAETPLAAPKPQEGFELPPMSVLARAGANKGGASETELADTAACLQETLGDFGIMATVVGWVAGPTVTLFKVDLPAGVRVSRVTALNDDIALALAAPGVRIFAPIPGTNYVGIEVPNRVRQNVLLGDVLAEAKGGPLQIAIGKNVEGECIVSDLAKMPHLLIGGTTGSGKSVSINAMIMSILMRATPAEVRFIMIDPKRVEFSPYNGIPHLYVPVVTEAKEAASALSWGVAEMERRLKVFSKVGARNIGQYNAKAQAEQEAIDAAEAAGEEIPERQLEGQMPYIVIIIDELADLMMNVGKEVEFSISRIAQLARAAGIHLIVATQRPSANVVTGLIKANITNRIAFNVATGIDSRVILDTPGAENLIGLGDLLFSKPEYAKPQRIQGCYVSEDEINDVVDMLKSQGEPEYHSEILKTNLVTLGASSPDGSGGGSSSDDPLLWEAADIVVSAGFGSTSSIQRRLKVGYSRAGRIMDMLEEKGIVGPPNGSKPRDILVDEMELETLKAFEAHDAADDSSMEV